MILTAKRDCDTLLIEQRCNERVRNAMSEVAPHKKIEDTHTENATLVHRKSEKREANRKIVIGEKLLYLNRARFTLGTNAWRREGG